MTGRDPRYGGQAWKKLRRAILDRDGHRCQLQRAGCLGVATTVDHRIPSAIAPADADFYDPANLRAACQPCNSSAGATVRHRDAHYRTTQAPYLTRF